MVDTTAMELIGDSARISVHADSRNTLC